MLPTFLPSLVSLTLDNSLISSLRDLGTQFTNLQTISLSNLKLTELDGISSLSNLRDLRLSNNLLSDLTPLAMHETLQVLDLSKNKISSFQALTMLSTCQLLYSLDLRKNFIEKHTPNYRVVVRHHVPQVKKLDGRQTSSDGNLEGGVGGGERGRYC